MERVMQVLLILHVLLSLVYAYDWFKEHERVQEALFRLVMVLLIPVVGFLFFHVLDFASRRNQEADLEGLYLGSQNYDNDLELLRPMDMDAELNRTSVEDALRMGDYRTRRQAVMETLKTEDNLEYLEVLRKALENEDSETSHYASAVIMDIQKKIQDNLTMREAAFEREPDNVAVMQALEQELYRVITSGVYDEHNLHKYYVKYKMVSDALHSQEEPQEEWFHGRVQVDLATGDVGHARQVCRQFRDCYPDSEDMVVDTIKVCIKASDREGLDEFLAQIPSMPVLLTDEALQYIRFFRKRGRT